MRGTYVALVPDRVIYAAREGAVPRIPKQNRTSGTIRPCRPLQQAHQETSTSIKNAKQVGLFCCLRDHDH